MVVSIIIPVYNEEKHIEGCITSLLAKQLDGSSLEVLVLDGMSTDATRAIVKRLSGVYPSLRLIDNPEKTVPFAMNRGIRAAKGSVIIRVDGHATVAPDFVETCLAELEAHPECACVGGFIENVYENDTARAISLAMSSPFGVGNALFRLGNYEGYVDTLAFGAYRKAALEEVGLFDEVLTRNQDDELNYRLIKAGYKIWMSKRIRSKYYVRASYKKLFRQYYQYGYWKVYVNRKHKTVTNLRQLVPVLFVAFLVLGLLLSLFSKAALVSYLTILGIYVAGGGVFALRQDMNPARALKVLLAFWTLHFAYGLGYLEGLFHFLLLGKQPSLKNAQVSR